MIQKVSLYQGTDFISTFLYRIYLMTLLSLGLWACQSKYLEPTLACSGEVPNTNTNHPKKAVYEAIMAKYVQKGLPGIVLLIRDEDGIFVAAQGKADIKRNILMQVCHVSKIASITKTFVGVLALKPFGSFLCRNDSMDCRRWRW